MEQCTNQVIGNRHSRVEDGRTEHVEKGGTKAGEDDAVHVVNASVSPQAAVQSEPRKHHQTKNRVPWGETKPGGEIAVHRHRPELEVHIEPDKESQIVREIHSDYIQ